MARHESKHPSIFPWKTSTVKRVIKLIPKHGEFLFRCYNHGEISKTITLYIFHHLWLTVILLLWYITISPPFIFATHQFAPPTWHKSLLWWQNPHCIHPVSGINFRFQRPGRNALGCFRIKMRISLKSVANPYIMTVRHLSTIFKDFIFSYWGMIPFYVLWDSITFIRLVAPTPSQTWRRSIPGSRQIRTIARWPCCNEDATQKAKNIWHHPLSACISIYIYKTIKFMGEP